MVLKQERYSMLQSQNWPRNKGISENSYVSLATRNYYRATCQSKFSTAQTFRIPGNIPMSAATDHGSNKANET